MKRFLLHTILFVCLLFTGHSAYCALPDTSEYCRPGSVSFAFNALPGFLWGHKENVVNVECHNVGYELQVYKIADGCRWWHKYYNFPRMGVSLYYNRLGKVDITGDVIAVLPYFEFYILKKKRSHFTFRLGTGLSYHTRKFDLEDNLKNKVIGSSINYNMFAGLIWHQALGKRMEFNTGLALCHFSNAHIKEPNYGINMPSFLAGLGYRLPGNYTSRSSKQAEDPPVKRSHFQAQFMLTNKEELSNVSKRFWIKGLFLSYGFQHSPISKWTTGLDLWLDKTYYYKKYREDAPAPLPVDRQLEVGLRAGHELRAGNLCLITDLGVYLYKPLPEYKKKSYQRLGLRYYFGDHVFLGASLKVHYGRADYLECSIGVDL